MTRMIPDAASPDALTALHQNGWVLVKDGNAIAKTYKFKTFCAAFGWMTQVALWAEKLDHHPEWSNVYNQVDVILTTHDTGDLSELDITLAQKMDAI